MSETETLSLAEIEDLALAVLQTAGADDVIAAPIAKTIAQAERDGLSRFGLASLDARLEQIEAGRVDVRSAPDVQTTGPSSIWVDAKDGFVEPALEQGLMAVSKKASDTGVCAMAITNAWNPGVLGHAVETLAHNGLVALATANTPRTVAPAGGKRALFGSNPIAFAAPRRATAPMVIDQSMSLMTRADVFAAAEAHEPLPMGVGLDQNGDPTTDPVAVLDGGSILSPGGAGPMAHKATNLMIMFEVLAGALAGASLSFQANGYEAPEGPRPRTGLFFLALDPTYYAGSDFMYRLEDLLNEVKSEPGLRLPGLDRLATRERTLKEGVAVDADLVQTLRTFSEDGAGNAEA